MATTVLATVDDVLRLASPAASAISFRLHFKPGTPHTEGA
jgi:hypothetical protein